MAPCHIDGPGVLSPAAVGCLRPRAGPETGLKTVEQLSADLQDPGLPPELNRLGRTLSRWRTPISSWHAARVTNAATEAANNLVQRVKRAAFGY